jgi:hypothetical protein
MHVLFPGALSATFVHDYFILFTIDVFLTLKQLPQALFVSKQASVFIRPLVGWGHGMPKQESLLSSFQLAPKASLHFVWHLRLVPAGPWLRLAQRTLGERTVCSHVLSELVLLFIIGFFFFILTNILSTTQPCSAVRNLEMLRCHQSVDLGKSIELFGFFVHLPRLGLPSAHCRCPLSRR